METIWTRRLKAVLKYVKSPDCDSSWQGLRDTVLSSLYHPNMAFLDVFRVLMHAYERALMEPRFGLPGRQQAAEDLILSPVKGCMSIDLIGPKEELETKYTVEQFYGTMIAWMLSNLRLTRIDWCRDELGLDVLPSAA